MKEEPAKKDTKSCTRKINTIKPLSSVPPKIATTQTGLSKPTSTLSADVNIEPTATSNVSFVSTTSSPYAIGNTNTPINSISPSLPRDIKISPVPTRDVGMLYNTSIPQSASRDVRCAPSNQTPQALPRDLKMYPGQPKLPQFSAPFAAAFDSMHTITNVERRAEVDVVNSTQQMPQLSIPEPKDPYIEHEQMPLLDPHSPVTHSGMRQAVAPHISFMNTAGLPSTVTTPVAMANTPPMMANQGLLNVYSIKTVQPVNGVEKVEQPVLCASNPQNVTANPPVVKQHKPNLIWNNHKYYTVNQCPETTYLNNDRFYPMTQAPIKLKGGDDKKVVVENIPPDVNEGITALKNNEFDCTNKEQDRKGGNNSEDITYRTNRSSSSSSSSSDSESDSETEDCKLQLSSDESSCYSPGGSDISDSSSDDDDFKPNMRMMEPEKKYKDYLPETIKSTREIKGDTTVPQNFNRYVADEKENFDSGQKKRRSDGEKNPRVKKRGKKPRCFKKGMFNGACNALGRGRKGKRPSKKPEARPRIRPYLSEIILGVRKKGRPNKNVQHKFTAIKNIINNFKDRFNFKPAKGPQSTNPDAPLSKYLAYKKASLTPLDCCVEVQDVLSRFSKDFQEYLKSGLTLFNVSSIPIAQSCPASDSNVKEESSSDASKQMKKPPNKSVSRFLQTK